jgi:hypothetical protein
VDIYEGDPSLKTGDIISISHVKGMSEINEKTYKVLEKNGNVYKVYQWIIIDKRRYNLLLNLSIRRHHDRIHQTPAYEFFIIRHTYSSFSEK